MPKQSSENSLIFLVAGVHSDRGSKHMSFFCFCFFFSLIIQYLPENKTNDTCS